MFVVELCRDLYFLVCEIARSKLTSFVPWGLDWSRDDEETVRGLVSFWESFLVLNFIGFLRAMPCGDYRSNL